MLVLKELKKKCVNGQDILHKTVEDITEQELTWETESGKKSMWTSLWLTRIEEDNRPNT